MIPALLLAAAALAGGDAGRHCYNLGQGVGTHYYPVSDRTILVSSGIHAYRIETEPAQSLRFGSSNLQVRGSGIVCSPLELQLFTVGAGGRTGLIVRSITPLSRAEAEELRHGAPKATVLRR